jgi:hypothetical protein
MEATYSSKMFVDFLRITKRYILEDRIFQNHRRENLKYYMEFLCEVATHR